VRDMSTRDISWGKVGRWVGLTTFPPLCTNCLEIWEPELPGALRACLDVHRNCFSIVDYNQLSHTTCRYTFIYTVTNVTYLAPVVKPDDPLAYTYVHLQQTANDTPNGPFATRHVVPEVKFEKKTFNI